MSRMPLPLFMAEILGTFVLVFAGTGAIIINDISGGAVTHVGIALTFGLAVMVMICAVGNVSGAHMNPAVTLGFLAAGRFRRNLVFPYIIAQCTGALLASFLLYLLFPEHPTLGATLPVGGVPQAFVLEFILTFLLMFVILSVSADAADRNVSPAIAIGSVVALEALFAGPISGASMNPARSLAPALVSGMIEHLWIYLSATVLGAIAAVMICRCVHMGTCCNTHSPGLCP